MVIFSPHRGQWRKGRGLMGNLTGRLTVLRPNAVIGESFSEVEAVIKCLLTIQSRCGAIGARNYLGYGVYQLKDTHNEIVCPSNEERLQFLTHIDKIKERKNRRLDLATGYPSLNEMFFYRIRFSEPIDRYAKDIRTLKRQRRQMRDKLGWEGVEPDVIQKCVNSGFVPVAPTVRYSLRGLFAGRTNESIRHEIFGEVSGSNKVGSKIAVSDFYRIGKEWELRIWGYIPPSLPNITSTRNKIDSNIRSATFWQTCFDISSLSGPSVDCQDIQRHGGNYRAFLEALMSW